ncbi:hypothetical protein ACFL6M_00630 [Candidatus Eisenbacteria bacterium]|uniref:Prolipoprotein diacylglyceryl transferase n=1 Tax=Eiseniibacteriota bacterium TaxID=2212470 RepID=A0ABV6YIC5_UNCEI
MNISTDIWVWVGVVLTFCIYSFLYRDNPFYRFGEHIFVGVANAFTLSFMYHRIIVPIMGRPFVAAWRIAGEEGLKAELFDPRATDANFLVIIPGLIGCLYLARFIKRATWMVRIPIGMFMGYYTGRTVPAYFEGSVFPQMRGTLVTQANFDPAQGGGVMGGIFAIIILVGVIGTLMYFYFSKEHKGVLKWGAQTGIVFVMVGFGASFGFTVMARVSLAIGRFVFLLRDWLGIVT